MVVKKDYFAPKSAQQYCFKIFHDTNLDLTSYYLVVDINGKIVYSGDYKSKIIFSFEKTTKLNTLSVCLGNLKKEQEFCWENKDVYDFQEESVKCYDVKLLSEKNMDYSAGIKMKIY